MTTYQTWLSTVPSEITADPLWHMEVDRIALCVGEICFAREARDWYYKSRHILSEEVALHRMRLLVSIIRTLLKIIPEFRAKQIASKIAEELAPYEVHPLESLLENVPFSEI